MDTIPSGCMCFTKTCLKTDHPYIGESTILMLRVSLVSAITHGGIVRLNRLELGIKVS